ncbi:DNRLRE domain-containing protein, partial [Clostridium perfringens]
HGFTGEAKSTADAEAWAFMDQHVKNLEVTTPILYKDGYTPPDPTDPTDPTDPSPGIPVEVGRLEPSDDALIDSSKPDTNINSAPGTSLGLFSVSSGTTNKKVVYFKFDASTLSNPDYRYEFQIAAKKGTSNTDLELSLYGIENTAWNESELTWNNAPTNSLDPATYVGSFTV